MTYKIKQSDINRVGIDYSAAVIAFAEELKAYAQHMELVEKGKAQFYPPPEAPIEISAAIHRPDLSIDYEIIDDVTPTLEEKKRNLVEQLEIAKVAAMNKVMPQGKRRLANIIHLETLQQISDRSTGLLKAKPTKTESKVLNDMKELNTKSIEIEKCAAIMHAEIEDLTEENIDHWMPKKFLV